MAGAKEIFEELIKAVSYSIKAVLTVNGINLQAPQESNWRNGHALRSSP